MHKITDKNKFFGFSVKTWWWILVLVPGIPFFLGSLLILGYSNIPLPVGNKVKIEPVNDKVEELIVLVHGKGDRPSSWAAGFAEELREKVLTEGQQVVTVDWGDYSNDLFRSTFNARRIGHDLGRRISRHGNVKRLHLIGHSAGSFVVFGICEAVKNGGRGVAVHATYLDPVSIYGGVDWGFGTRNFGTCADFSDAYIDHEDGVPGSNAPLEHAHTFDVTGLKKVAGFTGSPHIWPIEYYRQSVLNKTLPLWDPDESVRNRYRPDSSTIM